MAREITVSVWCDNCMKRDGTRTPGVELPPFAFSSDSKSRVLAWCDPCKAEVYAPLHDLWTDRGQVLQDGANAVPVKTTPKATKPKRVTERTSCPVDGCDYVGVNLSAARAHARTVHNATLDELLGKPTPFKCLEPRCGRKFKTPQGLGQHRRGHRNANERALAS